MLAKQAAREAGAKEAWFVDAEGRVQPAPEEPSIKLKRTYWEANQQWPRRLRL